MLFHFSGPPPWETTAPDGLKLDGKRTLRKSRWVNFRKQYHRLNSDTLSATEIISGRFGSPNERTSVREKSHLADCDGRLSITTQPPQSISGGITKQSADRSSIHILFRGSVQKPPRQR
ncbi:hypothetical protein [Mesorhizobium ciceri]|uniref:hypothetical protein n=1 Tax=Mesorhizobium ciceri TaxID=39645 RepID=UPI0013E8B75F|nr:hypothetical protein [Mesorhizobium ciceri]